MAGLPSIPPHIASLTAVFFVWTWPFQGLVVDLLYYTVLFKLSQIAINACEFDRIFM